MRKMFALLLTLSLIIACRNEHEMNIKSLASKKESKTVIPITSTPKTISIYRYDNFSLQSAQKLESQLKMYFPNVVLKEKTLLLPTKHYNKERNRYRGTGLFDELSKHRDGDAVIGLTNKVIFQTNEISPTYGIMGISPVGTYKCVVSSKLPKTGKDQSEENFVKLSLHELGHAFGLNHCPDQHCFMVDAEHKMKFPQTTNFCKNCKSKLNAKGWTIK